MKSLLFITLFLTLGAQAKMIDGQFFDFGGMRNYKVFKPQKTQTSPKSLFVMLHGCLQDPAIIAGGTRLNQLAEKHNFIVLYPEQSKVQNLYACWNWFLPLHQSTSFGEAKTIAKMIDKVKAEYKLKKVFIGGMSAGAAMANIVASCYSDQIDGLASHHGIIYKSAQNLMQARQVMENGSSVTPEQSAQMAYRCSRPKKKKALPAILFHGSRTHVMHPVHVDQMEKQVLSFNDYLDDGKVNHSFDPHQTQKTYKDSGRYKTTLTQWKVGDKVVVEKHLVEGLGHAWSGGDNAYEFNDAHGPDATKKMVKFLQNHGL